MLQQVAEKWTPEVWAAIKQLMVVVAAVALEDFN
nr:MAG TPA: hypothetical protein [Caudoviricetes sp.]